MRANKLLLAAIYFILLAPVVRAQDFSSSDFTVTAPVIAPGGVSTSQNFSLIGVISQIAPGASTGNTTELFSGFLYYPFVTTPALAATPGDTAVTLNWTSATTGFGLNVSGYSVGQATLSGGPYTYNSVGNALSSTRTGLTNGTPYFFIVRALDGLGNVIATSTEVSATPVASQNTGGGNSGGSGGSAGGNNNYTETGVTFSGRAYPLSHVTILKDGQVAAATIAGPDSNFKAALTGLSAGSYTFSVYGTDSQNVRSSPFTFPVTLSQGVTTDITGIFIAPTVSVDKSEVKRGDTITIFGESAPSAQVIVNVNSAQEYMEKTKSDKNGIYLLRFDSSLLDLGNHTTRSKSLIDTDVSDFGQEVGFLVGTKNVAYAAAACVKKGDVNGDCKVNLVDFSIAAFWYKKVLNDSFKTIESSGLSNDGKVDLVDFSIMAYYWTG